MFGHQYFHKLWPSNKWEQDTEFTVIGQSTSPGPANRRAMTKTAIETTRLVGCVCRVAGKQLGEKKKITRQELGFCNIMEENEEDQQQTQKWKI